MNEICETPAVFRLPIDFNMDDLVLLPPDGALIFEGPVETYRQ